MSYTAGLFDRSSNPRQSRTGRRGYLGKDGSLFERSQREKREPRVLPTTRWWRQWSQSPAAGAVIGEIMRTMSAGDRVTTSGGVTLVLAHAGPADQAELFEVWMEAVAEGGAFPRKPPVTDAEFRGAWMQGMTAVVVARSDGRMAGSYFLRPAYPGLAGHIANAGYLVPSEFRGKGVGTALAEHSFSEGRRNGFDAMLFQLVLETNPSARLWRRLGFDEVGRIPDVVEGKAALLFWRAL